MIQDRADIYHALKTFVRHPIEEIAKLPNWSIRKVLISQAICAAIAGVLAGLFPPSLWKVLNGGILFPILVSVMGSLLACFFYYYFQIFERRTVSFTKLVELVFFANLPYFLFHIPSSLFPPADVFGLGMASLLLVVGLTENFQLEKKKSLRLMGIVFGLLFILWLGEKVSSMRQERLSGMPAAEDSLPH